MSGHPLEHLARCIADEDSDGFDAEIQFAARLLLALHPDVARCALALASGLVVPEGFRTLMDDDGTILVECVDGGHTTVISDWERVNEFIVTATGEWRDTPQAAVAAAVKALGGAT